MSNTKIRIEQQNDAVHFTGTNSDNIQIQLDGSAAIGGEGKGVRPMEMVLFAVAGCSGIDIVSLLKKMRQPLEQLNIDVEGFREEGAIPAVYTKIHIHYQFKGAMKEEKVQRAIELSLGKYCSVSKMLEKAATISSSYSIE